VPPRAVVVGASLAGLRAAEALRRGGHDGPITVVGAEPYLPYDRPPLSKQVLTGKIDPADTALDPDKSLDLDWILGVRATGLDLARSLVILDGPEPVPFDRLVIATGAAPRLLPGFEPGPGVHYLRTRDDAARLRRELVAAERLVVIGAGFIGLEVAASAHELGLGVTVLEALPVPLERAIGARMGQAVAELHRRRGVEVRTSVDVAGLVRSGSGAGGIVEGVRLGDGSMVPAQVVVVGVGVAPVTGWLEGSGLDLGDGVLCDDRLRALAGGRIRPDIAAAGDVARWTHPRTGEAVRIEHWTNAADQGEAAAQALLLGDDAPPYGPVPYFWSDQHGVKIQFVGGTRPGDEVAVIEGDPAEDRFVAAYGNGGRLVAALGMRRPARVMALQRLIGEGGAFPPDGNAG
jgi:3-phenylpropionate/trans-cinnamate dioxygenase ferredoxin reductase component